MPLVLHDFRRYTEFAHIRTDISKWLAPIQTKVSYSQIARNGCKCNCNSNLITSAIVMLDFLAEKSFFFQY